MVADKVGVDRCAWYKSDRYYPEDRLVQVAGRFPLDRPLEHAAGSGWYEIAPLGRTWYEVVWQSQALPAQASQQRFVPQEGTLYSSVDYGPVRVEVTTFLHATESLLIEHYAFDQEVEFRAWMGPGVWVDDGWDTDPFNDVTAEPPGLVRYDLGETNGEMSLRLEPAAQAFGGAGRDLWVGGRGKSFVKYFAIRDNRQGLPVAGYLDQALSTGYSALRQSHLAFWSAYFAASRVQFPDEQFQRFYDASQYHFKAMQNPESGGLPVNNLRRTWSSHVFWDSYFAHRALLEANHRPEALEGCRFFQRTLEHAQRHAREEFDCDGLKWDWEITHDGRKAYGTLLHMKHQVHNNASYANMIWQYYEFTRDEAMLREFFPILGGLARFFLACIVERTPRGLEILPVVGVSENPIRVRNEGITLTGVIAILRHVANSARLLGLEDAFTAECSQVAAGLTLSLEWLYNGRHFVAAEGASNINMSSIAPIYPMQVVGYDDGRARGTVADFLDHYRGKMVGHGGSRHGFPWAAGVLATVLARMGDGERAWAVINDTRPAICVFGGMTEVMEAGQWNMQYFGTAQAAVCTALHNLLLQSQGDEVRLFPALPAQWQNVEFDNLLAAGLAVSARYASGNVTGRIRSLAPKHLSGLIRYAGRQLTYDLMPGQEKEFEWRA
jgi:hypothetical protein